MSIELFFLKTLFLECWQPAEINSFHLLHILAYLIVDWKMLNKIRKIVYLSKEEIAAQNTHSK